MLRRKAMDSLIEWKNRPGHKPLVVRGIRQCGKTFIIDRFRETYPHSAKVTLSIDRDMARLFETSRSVDDILTALQVRDPRFDPVPGETLIFLDEIQSCRAAGAFLKEFALDGRFDVIASGSLLGVRLRNDSGSGWDEERGPEGCDVIPSVPVGYREGLRMYSLDFEEFLWAKGYRESQIAEVRESIASRTSMNPVLLDAFNGAFREFMMVGGMPAVVSAYVGSGLKEARRITRDVLTDLREDVAKYSAEADTLKIRRCFDSLPVQLSDTNKKFMYSRVGGTGSREGSRRFSDALLWLDGAGIGNLCFRLTEVASPLSDHRDRGQFRMYVSDTGLLIGLMDDGGDHALRALAMDDPSFNQGALAENAVAECLMKAGIGRQYYLKRKDPGRMELDFVVDSHLGPIAVEVKSGKDRTAPSLRKTLGDPRFSRRIVLGRSDVGSEGGFENYPLFAAAFIKDIIADDDWEEGYGSGPSPPDVRRPPT